MAGQWARWGELFIVEDGLPVLVGTAKESGDDTPIPETFRELAVYMRAASVAEEVFAANPRHPGAAHYLIHS